MTRIFFYTFILLSLTYVSDGQESSFYMFNEKWEPTTVKEAVYMLVVKPVNDTCWQYDTYNMYGPLISTQHFKDEGGAIAHGLFVFYNARGTRDSVQYYSNKLACGKWQYYDGFERIYKETTYIDGHLQQPAVEVGKDSAGNIQPRIVILGDTFRTIEVESEFPGGEKGWIKFMGKNFRYPQRAIDRKIDGTVIVQFIVDKDGIVIDPEIAKSVEYSLDQETLRILKKSPKWIPAFKNGEPVKSYKKQPITYRLN